MSYFGSVTIKDLVISIRDLLKAMTYPAWYDRSIQRLRQTAIIESGTITTVSTVTSVTGVTTVTTVTGLTNLDGYQAKLPVINNNMAAWALAVRARIS